MKIEGIARMRNCLNCGCEIHYIQIPNNKLFDAPVLCDKCALDIYRQLVGGKDCEGTNEGNSG